MRELAPAVVILDIMLPGLCGLELCEAMARDPELAATPVIITSARTAPRDRANAELAGAVAFLPKPVDPQSLILAVAGLHNSSTRASTSGAPGTPVRVREAAADRVHL